LRDPTISVEVHRLACAICGKDAGPVVRQHAVAVAENQLLLLKVRAARVAVIEQLSPMSTTEKEHLSGPELESRVLATDSAVHRSSTEQLTRLDRYERAALARRKRAIRGLSAL
jgi:hypothetical protein